MITNFIICVGIIQIIISAGIFIGGIIGFKYTPRNLSTDYIIKYFCKLLLPFNMVTIAIALITQSPIFLGLYLIPLSIILVYIIIEIFFNLG